MFCTKNSVVCHVTIYVEFLSPYHSFRSVFRYFFLLSDPKPLGISMRIERNKNSLKPFSMWHFYRIGFMHTFFFFVVFFFCILFSFSASSRFWLTNFCDFRSMFYAKSVQSVRGKCGHTNAPWIPDYSVFRISQARISLVNRNDRVVESL